MRIVLISAALVMVGCGAGSTADSAASSRVLEQGCAPLGTEAFLQGPLITTNLPSDLALNGPGFFIVKDTSGVWFARDGHFTIDAERHFVHVASGARLQSLAGVDVSLGNQLMAPIPTSNITLIANLDAQAPIQVWDPTQPATTSNSSSSTALYDNLGTAIGVDVYWTHTAAGVWEFHAMVDGARVAGGTAGGPSEIANGTLTFDSNGRLDTTSESSHFIPLNAIAPQALFFNFGDALVNGGTGLAGVTQFSAFSATIFTAQDGAPAGTFSTFSVNWRGELIGTWSNGFATVITQIAVATFPQPQSLLRRGNGLFGANVGSGDATIGAPGDTVRAGIVGASLEKLPDFSKCVVQ
ncbi:MAG: flagellar hook-basal body complex protein [Archangium sp.]